MTAFMKVVFLTALIMVFCLVGSCAKSEGNANGGGDINGTWVGDFGPAFYDRNTISLELHWDGKELTGMVRPGVQGGRMYRNFTGFPIENGSFDPKTGVIKFEANYKPRERLYIIEGKLKNNTLSGSWNRPDEKRAGDFKLTKKSS